MSTTESPTPAARAQQTFAAAPERDSLPADHPVLRHGATSTTSATAADASAQLAMPGSETAPDGLHLADATSMGAPTLLVSNLETMSDYYSRAFAMEPLEEHAAFGKVSRVLGRGTTPLIRLVQVKGLPPVDPRQPGLYHTAFLFDSQESLAATVLRAAQDPRSMFVGSSDHSVSEAFYFNDPEGNGVELYVDRPRNQWRWINGQVQMDTVYLDPNAFLRAHLTDTAVSAGSMLPGTVGHVHLQVGDLRAARRFYVDALGFDTTLDSYTGALFASAGGYHHHVAMNVWNSRGAGPRAATLGLGDLAVTVPQRTDLDALATRLRTSKLQFADDGRSIQLPDPWGTHVTVSLPDVEVSELLTR